ncbi:MAG: S-layer family protein [Firmicutes bacterium]|nr:S-layer family protein [Bacillota bacterium]
MKKIRKRFITVILLFFVLSYNITTYFHTFSEYVSKIETNNTGIVNNVVMINELENDYNYYMGLNYVSSDGTLPTLTNKNIYNENNLIETKIIYHGNDILSNNRGYVSIDEKQDTFIYNKLYVVNNNNTEIKTDDYVEIELIDNPFSDRPNDKVFNGWTTDYISSKIKYDNDYYVRTIKIPVTYENNIPNPIEIDLYANWIDGKISFVNSNTNWSSAFSVLDDAEMQPIGGQIPIYESVNGLYLMYSASFFNGYPTGAIDSNGQPLNGTCYNWGGCPYYLMLDENSVYDESLTYYNLTGNGNNKTMREYEVSIVGYEEIPKLSQGTILSGYYRQVDLRNSNIEGYYSIDGTIQSSSTCRNNCTYYELINYYDNNGNVNIADGNTIYYYLPTRDTNIIVMNENLNTKWEQDKPFTLTSTHNGIKYDITWNVSNQYITCYADTRIENIRINSNTGNSSSNPASNSTTTKYIYANYYNLKLGRGITQTDSYKNFNGVIGGNNNTSALGSTSSVTKYKLIVESGYYNNITLTNGPSNTNRSKYIEAIGVYGSDYDKVSKKETLDVYYVTAGSWGAGNYYASTNTGITFDTIIKSGKFGTGKYDHTTGVYIGGRSYGTHYTSRRVKVEGGWIYNLIGGPLTASNRADINDTYVYVTGGSIDMLIGGAGTSTTYGNRIISVTDGTINYSVFGGSNSYNGDTSEGKLTGSSYVHIGGNATIGNQEYIDSNTTLWGSESGSVFGIGNGNDASSTIGSNENSNIVITGGTILGNVYGGGNYSATGVETTKSTTTTNIKILNGTIKGSIYGGGNKNGSGSQNKNSTVNIEISNGIIGSIYGGSREKGTIYGTVNLNIYGGLFNNSIYGGGQGNETNILENINITYSGDNTVTNNSLYGGSEFGTINSNNITINGGTIKNSVYGGAKGNETYIPTVSGNTIITINNGNIGNIFGSNDYSGTISGTTEIHLNGGVITNVFGGGNKTSQNITNIYEKGSTVTNIYGGSNETGNVNTSNITVTSGTVEAIYGGNNIGGITDKSYINLNGGAITNVFGGGNKTSQNITNIELKGSTVTNIYGGSNETGNVNTSNITVTSGTVEAIYGGNNIGGITDKSYMNLNGGVITNVFGGGNKTSQNITNIELKGSTVTNIYGGSNETGDVNTSNITLTDGTANTVYGGNNIGGKTTDTNIILNGGNITNIYGGGKLTNTTNTNVIVNNNATNIYGGGENAACDNTTITINNGTITRIYGGSNESGDVIETNINIIGGNIENLYGGNNIGGKTTTSNIVIDNGNINTLYGGGNNATTTNTNLNLNGGNIENAFGGGNDSSGVTNVSNVNLNGSLINNVFGGGNKAYTIISNIKLNNGTITNIYGGGNQSGINNVSVNLYNGNAINVYGGSNESGDVNVSNIKTQEKNDSSIKVSNIYGGNNKGGLTNKITITLNKGEYDNIYGGGNNAPANKPTIKLNNITVNEMVYAGANQSIVNDNTTIEIKNSTIKGSVFGGGNAGIVAKDTNVYISNSNIQGSVYAGGNGSTAIVVGNTNLDIDGTTFVGKHVFGGGNAANTGSENTISKTIVNIAGATINGNVYGAGNTSIVYGNTDVNIGVDTLTKDNLIKNNIIINGTVFGGGEANEQGDENYDYSFISVTDGTNININGNNHDELTIKGSIFGSGNASSTEGYSYINISNYGTVDNYKTNISLQRANLIEINNSVIELIGATDRTNEYSTVEFSISRIKHLKLKNNSILYLNTGANLLEEYTSAVDIDRNEELETVTIFNEQINKNVDNKIFIKGGKNLNIATNENATSYGVVNGMTFFGMYTKDRDNNILTGLYDNYNFNDTINNNELYLFDAGSYVLGLHKKDHDITKDGFYSNYAKEGIVYIDYIKPTPSDSTYYMWSIGEQVISIELDLTASKYLTLGTEELGMLNYSAPNTTFAIVGFNYNELDSNVTLTYEKDIPRIAETQQKADNNMSLVMKSTNSGWITKGETTFLTNELGVSGTTFYRSENSTEVPSFQFYLYHSKNLGTSGKMGKVTISFVVTTPTSDLTNEIQRVNLIVNLDRQLYNTNDYEAAMTNGKEYDLFASSNVNLTSNGSLSAYYSLFVENTDNIYKDGYHRSLVSTYVFPVNTKITLLNLNENSTNEYYYYVVSEEDYNASLQQFNIDNEVSYDFSKFIRMGSTSVDNNYDDELNNNKYYNSDNRNLHEEFIVIVDFVDSNINEDVLNKSLLIELRDKDDETMISVLGIEQERMIYSLYADSNAIIDVEGNLSSNKVYPGKTVDLNVTTNFTRKIIDSKIIYDTNYFEQQLGVKISYLDSNGDVVTGASLLGVTYEYDGKIYYPRMDGSVRIRLAEKMANVSANIKINTTESVATANYTMVIESFGSSDGIYYGGVSSDTDTLPINILNTVYGLSLTMGDYILIRDNETGNNLNNNNELRFNLKYSSGLANPNVRMSLQRRKYDTIYSLEYETVDLQQFIKQPLQKTNKINEYLLTDTPLSDINYSYLLNENLKTGTYKFVISLYDSNVYIGDVYKYIIIKERYDGGYN